MGVDMKEKIVDAALELFNRNGSHCMTTNHIIAHIGISPGTFYYHFRNKEEIIRKIFSRITVDFKTVFTGEGDSGSLEVMIGRLREMFSLYNKYSFFYREISSLLDRDEKLKTEYLENYSYKREMMKKQFFIMEERGIVSKGFAASPYLDSAVDSLWVLCDYWTSFLAATGRMSEKNTENGYRNFLAYLLPYLEKNVRETVLKYL